jgi:hypothetical protein
VRPATISREKKPRPRDGRGSQSQYPEIGSRRAPIAFRARHVEHRLLAGGIAEAIAAAAG